MASIQSNNPVLARAIEFTQESKHKREVEQKAAAKVENSLNDDPANRVTFSQTAQIRLNEEKTHVANQVEEVRVASKIAAAEVRSKEIAQEHQKSVDARIEARETRVARDREAQDKTVALVKETAVNQKKSEDMANAAKKLLVAGIEKAATQHDIKTRQFFEKVNTDDLARTVKAQEKETSDLLEKSKKVVLTTNMHARAKETEVAVSNSRKLKAVTDHTKAETDHTKVITDKTKAETDKAMKMYHHVDLLVRPNSA